MKPTALIIGAGVVGLCTALRLQERGFHIKIIDRQPPGLGASFGNAGFIASESVEPLATPDNLRRSLRLWLNRYGPLSMPAGNWHRTLPWLKYFIAAARPQKVAEIRTALSALLTQAVPAWQRLLEDVGLSHYLVGTFYMRTWESAAGEAAARAEQAFYQQWRIEAEFADKNEVACLQPYLAETVHHAVLLPDAYRVSDPYALSHSLADILVGRGAEILCEEVLALESSGSGLLVTTSATAHQSDKAVLCGGAHSADLLKPLGANIPLMAERGYHLTLPRQQFLLNGPICSAERNVFLNPLDCGLRISGFSELGGSSLPAYPQRYAVLRHHLHALLPQSDSSDASEWMGMRPTLPDSLPVIDLYPGIPALGLAFGHQHLGLTLAARTAEIMADKLSGAEPTPETLACRLSRFN